VAFHGGEIDGGGTDIAWIIHFVASTGETDAFRVVSFERFKGDDNAEVSGTAIGRDVSVFDEEAGIRPGWHVGQDALGKSAELVGSGL
jgi:hypothetical protein